MTAVTDVMPLAGTLGGGFFIGLVAGYAIKKNNQNCSHNRRSVYCCISVYAISSNY
jgi:uncharacterized membrane protein (Fun14 family)